MSGAVGDTTTTADKPTGDPRVRPRLRPLPSVALSDLVALRLTYRWAGDAAIVPRPRPEEARARHPSQPSPGRLNSWFREQLLGALRDSACLHLQAPPPPCARCDVAVRRRCPLPVIYPPLGSGVDQPREMVASLHSVDVLHQGPAMRLQRGDRVRVDVLLMGPARDGAAPLLRGLRLLEGGLLCLERVDNVSVDLHLLETPRGRWPLPVLGRRVHNADDLLLQLGTPTWRRTSSIGSPRPAAWSWSY